MQVLQRVTEASNCQFRFSGFEVLQPLVMKTDLYFSFLPPLVFMKGKIIALVELSVEPIIAS